MPRIFIVEDEFIFQMELRQRMEELGHDVVGTSDNGFDAIRAVTSVKPDLVLMDVNIKGDIDGIETARLILEKYNVPIVYLTAYSDKTTLERAKITSPYAYLIKPIEDRSLNISIEVSLSNFNAEKKIRESERKLSITLHSIGDGVIATDDKSCVTLMNATAEKMCGILFEHCKGLPLKSIFNIIKAGDRSEQPNPVDEVFRTGKIVELANHTILVSADGTERHIADSAAPIINEEGKIEGVVLVFSDVSQAYKQREKLKQSEKIYREVVENASDIIYSLDINGKITHANSAAYKITGYSYEDIKKMYFTDFVAPEYRQQVKRKLFKQFFQKEQSIYFEVPVLKHNSEQIWFGSNINLVYEGNDVVGFHIVSRDITKQKIAEQNLKQSEEFNRKLVAALPDVVLRTDLDGTIVFVNDIITKQISGISKEEIIGKNIFAFMAEHEVERAIINTKLMFEKPLGPKEYVLKLSESTYGHFEVNGDVVLGINDKPIGMIYVVRDINERKRVETALQESEAKYRLLAENSTDLIYVYSFNPKPHYNYISPSCKRFTGYEPEEAYKDPGLFIKKRLVDGDEIERLNKYIFETPDNREPLVERWQKKDGTFIWVEQVIAKVYDDEGKVRSIQSTVRDITERKVASDSLIKSEERYRSLYNNSHVGIYRTTPEGRIIMANPALIEMLGYQDLSELQTRDLNSSESFANSADRELFKNKIEKEGQAINHDAEWLNRDGSVVYVREQAKAIKDADGNTIYYDGTVLNVTQQKKAYDQILMLSTIVKQSPLSILITDKEGVIEFANDKSFEVTGYSHSELIGSKVSILKSGKTANEKYQELWQTVKSGKIWNGELLNKKKNHDYYWAAILISPIVNYETEITNYVSISEDITQRKIIEIELQEYRERLEYLVDYRTKELKKSEEKFRALAENTEDIIIRFDREARILYINKAIEKIVNKKTAEIIGKGLSEINFTDNHEYLLMAITNVFRNKKEQQIEFQIPSGVWFDWILIPEYTTDGEVDSIITSARDITKLKAFEVELQKALQKEKELNELKSRFVSTVSHEFRTPLASILSSVQLIKRYSQKWSEEKLNEHYESIGNSIKNLTGLLDEVLTVNRNESGRYESVAEEVDIVLELGKIIEELKPLSEEKHEIEYTHEPNQIVLNVDKKVFRLIFVNLISNAIKYSPKGGLVKVHVVMQDGIVISVSDQGIGIKKADVDKIFEPFYRAKEVENINGNGLGLTIVKQSLDQIGAGINVDSIEGIGTTFKVVL